MLAFVEYGLVSSALVRMLRFKTVLSVALIALSCVFSSSDRIYADVAAQTSPSEEVSPKNILLLTMLSAREEWGERIVAQFTSNFKSSSYYVSRIDLDGADARALQNGKIDVNWIIDRTKASKSGTVVAMGQGAINFVYQNKDKFPKNVKLVLGGDIQLPLSREESENVFVISKALKGDTVGNINLGRLMFPAARKIVILTGSDETGRSTHELLKKSFSNEAGVEYIFINGRDYSTNEMLKHLAAISRMNSFVINCGWISSKDELSISSKVSAHLIEETANARVISTVNSNRNASLGGYMENLEVFGSSVGRITKEIINNPEAKKYYQLPLSKLEINWSLFDEKGISFSILPQARFYNTPPVLGFDDYKDLVLALSCIFGAIIVVFVFMWRKISLLTRDIEVSKILPMNVCLLDKRGNVLRYYGSQDEGYIFKNVVEFGDELSEFFFKNADTMEDGDEASTEFKYINHYRKCIMRKPQGRKFRKNTFIITTIDVSDLVAVRTQFQETVKKFHDTNSFLNVIIENIPCGIFVKNCSNRNKYVMGNKFFRYNIARHPENIEGLTDFNIFAPESASYCSSGDLKTIAEKGIVDNMEELVAKDGHSTKCHTIKTARQMENGDVYLFGISMDTTEMSRTQEKIRAHSEQMRVLNECLEMALHSKSSRDVVNNIISFVGQNLRAQRCYFVRYDDEGKKLLDIFEWVSDVSFSQRDYILSHPPADIDEWIEKLKGGEVVRQGISFASPRSLKSSRLGAYEGLTQNMAQVVQRGKDALGFIQIEFSAFNREITEFDEYLLKSASHILEVVIERLEINAKIEESEYMRGLILNSIKMPVMLFDSNKNIITANTAAEEFTNSPMQKLCSKPCHDNICKGALNNEHCLVSKCLKKEETLQGDIVTSDGKELHCTVTPIFAQDGRLKYVVENMIDMTEFNKGKKLLVRAMEDAQAADKAKSYFIATMSHELRTPLNAVIGYTELTQNPVLSQDERIQNLRNISFAANTLLNLINDILDLSKLEAGQMEIFPAPIDMLAVADEFIRIFKFSAEKKGIYIKFKVDENIPMLMIDLLRLKQILMNIIGNAIKFTDSGGVDVSVVFDKKDDYSGDLTINVKDSGIGMTPQFLEKVFSPFEQDMLNKKRGKQEGTGLGLSIVKRLVERMNGQISVTSVQNEGSQFKVVLKGVMSCERTEEKKPKTQTPESDEGDEIFNESIKVMIVDDVLLNVKVLRKMLLSINLSVSDFTSAKSALDALEGGYMPDLLMTDLWMPEMNGHEFAEVLKGDSRYSHIPIIAVTADTQVQDPEKVFDDILFKPITTQSIKDKIRNALNRS